MPFSLAWDSRTGGGRMKKMATPESAAKFREETSKKQRAEAALPNHLASIRPEGQA